MRIKSKAKYDIIEDINVNINISVAKLGNKFSRNLVKATSNQELSNQVKLTRVVKSGTWKQQQKPGTWNKEPGTWNLEPGTLNLEPETWNLETRNKDWNQEPGTRNQEPGIWKQRL